MSVEIVRKFENKYLNRVEYLFKITHEAKSTPSRKDIRKLISDTLKAPSDLIVISSIRTPFGKNESLVEVFIYNDKNKMLGIEPKHILKRNELINA